MHRDIKPENILLKSQKNKENGYIIKYADFGVCAVGKSNVDVNNQLAGTLIYMAPEIVRKEKYTYKCDVWSLGCVIYELCIGEPLIKGNDK